MNPTVTSLAGLAAVLAAACALLLMLELRGNPREDKDANLRLIKAHRFIGWLAAVLVLAVSVLMLVKAGGTQDEFPPRVLLHAASGILLTPLLVIKILIVRRFKRLGTMTPGFGLTVFFVIFLLYCLTGGHYLLHRADIGDVLLSEHDAGLLDIDFGQRLTAQKCGKCHSLERVFRAGKNGGEWTKTVNRMAALDAPNIRDFDAKQIIHYLTVQQERRKKLPADEKEASGGILVRQKCVRCHSLDRVHAARKSEAEWTETVGRMMEHADDPAFLSQEEKKVVVHFLSGSTMPPRQDE
jgi:cytochrome c2